MGPVRRLRLVITADDDEAAAAVALVALIAFRARCFSVGGASGPARGALKTVRQRRPFRRRTVTTPATTRRMGRTSPHSSKPFMATSTTSWSAMIDTLSSRSTRPGVRAPVLLPSLHRRDRPRIIRAE
jgi:hypothetical protein